MSTPVPRPDVNACKALPDLHNTWLSHEHVICCVVSSSSCVHKFVKNEPQRVFSNANRPFFSPLESVEVVSLRSPCSGRSARTTPRSPQRPPGAASIGRCAVFDSAVQRVIARCHPRRDRHRHRHHCLWEAAWSCSSQRFPGPGCSDLVVIFAAMACNTCRTRLQDRDPQLATNSIQGKKGGRSCVYMSAKKRNSVRLPCPFFLGFP